MRSGWSLMKWIILISVTHKFITLGNSVFFRETKDWLFTHCICWLTVEKTQHWHTEAQVSTQTKLSDSIRFTVEKNNNCTPGSLHKQSAGVLLAVVEQQCPLLVSHCNCHPNWDHHTKSTPMSFPAHSAEASHWSAITSNLKGCPY